jgi:uncharacterized Rmd1/YagE family protein
MIQYTDQSRDNLSFCMVCNISEDASKEEKYKYVTILNCGHRFHTFCIKNTYDCYTLSNYCKVCDAVSSVVHDSSSELIKIDNIKHLLENNGFEYEPPIEKGQNEALSVNDEKLMKCITNYNIADTFSSNDTNHLLTHCENGNSGRSSNNINLKFIIITKNSPHNLLIGNYMDITYNGGYQSESEPRQINFTINLKYPRIISRRPLDSSNIKYYYTSFEIIKIKSSDIFNAYSVSE